MNSQEFITAQSTLGLNGAELAEKLGVDPASISRWRAGQKIPDYIAKLMEKLSQEVVVHVPLQLLLDFSHAAEQQGLSFNALLLKALKREAAEEPESDPSNVTPLYETTTTGEPAVARVAEEPSQP